MKFIKSLLIVILVSLSLQGCGFVVGAAAGAAAIAVVYDHRNIQNSLKDTDTANKIVNHIRNTPGLRTESHIEVTAFNHIVLLTGETPKQEWKDLAGEIATSTPGITKVYNQITIQGPTSSLTRTSDAWITTKIKGLMLADDNLKSSTIKVTTENGAVYLMGLVTEGQADTAVNIARQVSGVQKVVKIFQYKK